MDPVANRACWRSKNFPKMKRTGPSRDTHREGPRYAVSGSCLAVAVDVGAHGGLRGHGVLGSFAVELAVHVRIANDDLNVLASFAEGDGFDEFGNFVVIAFRFPQQKAIFTSVVGGSSIFGRAGAAGKLRNVQHAEFDVQ